MSISTFCECCHREHVEKVEKKTVKKNQNSRKSSDLKFSSHRVLCKENLKFKLKVQIQMFEKQTKKKCSGDMMDSYLPPKFSMDWLACQTRN